MSSAGSSEVEALASSDAEDKDNVRVGKANIALL